MSRRNIPDRPHTAEHELEQRIRVLEWRPQPVIPTAWEVGGNAISGEGIFGTTNGWDVSMRAGGMERIRLSALGGIVVSGIGLGHFTYPQSGIQHVSNSARCTYGAQNDVYQSCWTWQYDGKWLARNADDTANDPIQAARFETSSSQDYKRNVRPAPAVRGRLARLAPRIHKSMLPTPRDPDAEHNPTAVLNAEQDRFSIVVEEVLADFPEFVAYNDEDGVPVARALDLGSVVGFLLAAVKEMDTEVVRMARTPTMEREMRGNQP